jgi:hypothetical protein
VKKTPNKEADRIADFRVCGDARGHNLYEVGDADDVSPG